MGKLSIYFTGSFFVAAAVMYYAYWTRIQFYPTVLFLVTSKFCIVVLCNMALVCTIILGKITKSIFLGPLRNAEVELLYENSRYAITETCLALTIFREEINMRVVILFSALLFAKIFHWLCQSRLEFVEQAEVIARSTHIRLTALMCTLSAIDSAFVAICLIKIMEKGPSVLILFGFEFFILLITLSAMFGRYILHLIDLRTDGTWTSKSTYVFYLELASEVTKLFVYLVFFLIIFTYYGMPLHIVRDLWMSIKNLQRRIGAYFRYRRLTANMNERFPDPTEEELNETDHTCIICREEMTTSTSKKIPCGHIFHLSCLRMWLQRQQTCPTCRANIPTDESRGNTELPEQPQNPEQALAPQQAAAVPAAAMPTPPPALVRTNVPAQLNETTTSTQTGVSSTTSAQGTIPSLGQLPLGPSSSVTSSTSTIPRGFPVHWMPPHFPPASIPGTHPPTSGIPVSTPGAYPTSAYPHFPMQIPPHTANHPYPMRIPLGPYGMPLGYPFIPPTRYVSPGQPHTSEIPVDQKIQQLEQELAMLKLKSISNKETLFGSRVEEDGVLEEKERMVVDDSKSSSEGHAIPKSESVSNKEVFTETKKEDWSVPIEEKAKSLESKVSPPETIIPDASSTSSRREELRRRYNQIYGNNNSNNSQQRVETKREQ